MSDKSCSRSRAPNFSKEEQLLLCSITERYTSIIESKKTDGVKHAHKQEAWRKIQEEYNSNTKGVPRTVDNLLACYRNLKSKIKKQHSEAKMILKEPKKKEEFLTALEENGHDWDTVSQIIEQPIGVCQESYKELQKELKKKETKHMRLVLGTGGGPEPRDDDDDAIERLKKIIEPQLDGLYTIYDADAQIMKNFQESQPDEEQKLPIEFKDLPVIVDGAGATKTPKSNEENSTFAVEVDVHATPKLRGSIRPVINRTEILKKRKDSALVVDDKAEESTSKKKKNVNDSFLHLSESKQELVALQKMSLELDISHKKKIQALELENLILENEHKEKMRQKELLLIEIKIKNESKMH